MVYCTLIFRLRWCIWFVNNKACYFTKNCCSWLSVRPTYYKNFTVFLIYSPKFPCFSTMNKVIYISHYISPKHPDQLWCPPSLSSGTTGSIRGCKMKLIIHLHLLSTLRKSVPKKFHTLYIFMACEGTTLPYTETQLFTHPHYKLGIWTYINSMPVLHTPFSLNCTSYNKLQHMMLYELLPYLLCDITFQRQPG